MSAPPPSTDFDRMESVQKLRNDLLNHGVEGWNKAWVENNTPWDAGSPQPPLVDILQSPLLQLPAHGKALVPGCGRGYDPIHIATALGIRVVGLDISETALNSANEYLRSLKLGPEIKVSFENADFFTLDVPDDERYNLIYDYTFFCAIPPDLRAPWGKKMTELVVPGGFLITTVFPIDGDRLGGPPYSVNVDMVANVLGVAWRKVVDEMPARSLPKNMGRERMVVWQREWPLKRHSLNVADFGRNFSIEQMLFADTRIVPH